MPEDLGNTDTATGEGPRRTVDDYLQRIGHVGPVTADLDTLFRLHQAHLMTVPFENLDIHLGRPIEIDLVSFYDKIVRRRRGGFCYELNGLFSWLLRELGYQVTLLSGRVCEHEREGPEFDHLTLLVQLDRPWLADVGFGESFLTPLLIEDGLIQEQAGRSYRLINQGPNLTLWRRRPNLDWERQYSFSLRPRRLSEFADMCRHHQSSPESTFTRGRICSRTTEDGRITLTDDRLIVTRGEERREISLGGPEEFGARLRQDFGIDLSQ